MVEKKFFTIGEVAELLDVTQATLRHWEKSFKVLKPAKNARGRRLFTTDDVRNLKTIYHLVKERGMTLAGAEKQLKARHSETERDMELVERLSAIRALLVEVRSEIGGAGDGQQTLFDL